MFLITINIFIRRICSCEKQVLFLRTELSRHNLKFLIIIKLNKVVEFYKNASIYRKNKRKGNLLYADYIKFNLIIK
jgi:hypothetical protein